MLHYKMMMTVMAVMTTDNNYDKDDDVGEESDGDWGGGMMKGGRKGTHHRWGHRFPPRSSRRFFSLAAGRSARSAHVRGSSVSVQSGLVS